MSPNLTEELIVLADMIPCLRPSQVARELRDLPELRHEWIRMTREDRSRSIRFAYGAIHLTSAWIPKDVQL